MQIPSYGLSQTLGREIKCHNKFYKNTFLNSCRSNLRTKGSIRLCQHHGRRLRQRRDSEQDQKPRSSDGELRGERPSGRRLRLRDHVLVPGRDRQTSAKRCWRTAHSGRWALHCLHQELGLLPKIRISVSQKQHAQRHLYLQGILLLVFFESNAQKLIKTFPYYIILRFIRCLVFVMF